MEDWNVGMVECWKFFTTETLRTPRNTEKEDWKNGRVEYWKNATMRQFENLKIRRFDDSTIRQWKIGMLECWKFFTTETLRTPRNTEKEDWKIGRLECWNGGMLEDVFTTKVRRTQRNGQIFEVERRYKCCLALGLKQKKEKQIFIPAFLILNLLT